MDQTLGLVCLLVALPLLGTAAWLLVGHFRDVRGWRSGTGRVVDRDRSYDASEQQDNFAPVVEFTPEGQPPRRFVGGARSVDEASVRIGAPVAVRWDPADPSRAELRSALTANLAIAWGLLLPGLALAIVGAVALRG